MKKDTLVTILFILISIPLGIFLSKFLNTNPSFTMFQRIGYSLIFAGSFILLREITFIIRNKMNPQTFSELFSLEKQDEKENEKEKKMIIFDEDMILKENNEITFKIDLLRQYFRLLAIIFLLCALPYIILPSMINKELLDLSNGLLTWAIILICIIIFIFFLYIIPVFFQIYAIFNYNVIRIIDADKQTFTITNKKHNLTIPFSNLKDLEVRKYKDTTQYYLIVPFINYSGDISKFYWHRFDDSIILLADKKKEKDLLEIKDCMVSFLSKFSF